MVNSHWRPRLTEDAIEHLFCSHLEEPLGLHIAGQRQQGEGGAELTRPKRKNGGNLDWGA